MTSSSDHFYLTSSLTLSTAARDTATFTVRAASLESFVLFEPKHDALIVAKEHSPLLSLHPLTELAHEEPSAAMVSTWRIQPVLTTEQCAAALQSEAIFPILVALYSPTSLAAVQVTDEGQLRLGASAAAHFTWQPVAASAPECHVFPEMELGVHATPVHKQHVLANMAAAGAEEAVVGYADLHAHLFSHDGFGGLAFAGAPFHPLGVAAALPDCRRAHGWHGLGDVIGNVADGRLGHATDGYPSFNGWPSRVLSDHQQMYYEWLHRAFVGGLRLLTTFAVTNNHLCRAARRKEGFTCDTMDAVDRQFTDAWAMQDFIDAQSGGPGKGWFRIVLSPADARAALRNGQMAVVLGIEVDEVFGCTVDRCNMSAVLTQLDQYYARGLRTVFPLHLFDNGFGGTAFYLPTLQRAGNPLLSGHMIELFDCADLGYEFKDPILSLGSRRKADCNTRSLTPQGREFLEALMKKKLLIQINHMSARTLNASLDVLEAARYPGVVAGHTWLLDTAGAPQSRFEAALTRDAALRVLRLGGVVAPILFQGPTTQMTLSVPVDCPDSSQTFAQALVYATKLAEEGYANVSGPRSVGVGFGSDFNGFIHQFSPRFGEHACAGNAQAAQNSVAREQPIVYPFTAPNGVQFGKQKFGPREWDYNTDGLVHVGLVPDFIEDLRLVGLSDHQLAPLYRSVESFLQMWEATEVHH